MIGVIYARYSHGPKQTDQSIEGQVASCMEYAKRENIEVVEVYADRHVSANDYQNRTEFNRMMRDADAHKFDCIILWKVDRFGRNREEIALGKMRLKKAGVKLCYAAENIPDTPEGIILESLMEGLAEYYVAELKQKILRGQLESVKKGHYIGGRPPFGYDVKDKKLVPNEREAQIVRNIFDWFISGMTYKEIADRLAAHGVYGRTGKPFSKNAIYAMLRNEHYIGEYKYHGEIPVPNEPIITLKQWYDAHALAGTPCRASSPYLLSMKCYCGHCGRLLNGSKAYSHTGVPYFYYRCPDSSCELQAVQKDELEALVVNKTVEYVLTDEMIGKIADKIMDVQNASPDPSSGLKKEAEDTQRQITSIVNAIASVGVSQALTAKLCELEEHLAEVNLNIARAKIASVRLSREQVVMWLESFKAGDVDDLKFREKLCRTFLARVDVWNNEILLTYNLSENATKKAPSPGSCEGANVDIRGRYANLCIIGSFLLLRLPRGLSQIC